MAYSDVIKAQRNKMVELRKELGMVDAYLTNSKKELVNADANLTKFFLINSYKADNNKIARTIDKIDNIKSNVGGGTARINTEIDRLDTAISNALVAEAAEARRLAEEAQKLKTSSKRRTTK